MSPTDTLERFSVENPPAFPVSTIDGFTEFGMSLRDWFAGQAPRVPDDFSHPGLPSCLAMLVSEEEYADHEVKLNEWLADRAASWAFAYADAMLATRAKGGA